MYLTRGLAGVRNEEDVTVVEEEDVTVVAMVAEEEEVMVAVGGEVTVEGVTELPVGVVGATVEPYERRLCVKNNFPPLNEDTVGNDEAVSGEMVLKGAAGAVAVVAAGAVAAAAVIPVAAASAAASTAVTTEEAV